MAEVNKGCKSCGGPKPPLPVRRGPVPVRFTKEQVEQMKKLASPPKPPQPKSPD